MSTDFDPNFEFSPDPGFHNAGVWTITGEAGPVATPGVDSPRQTILPQAPEEPTPDVQALAATPIRQALFPPTPIIQSPAEPSSDEGRNTPDTLKLGALVGSIRVAIGPYGDFCRGRQRLLLQGMAICRRFCRGDKEEGAALYRRIERGSIEDPFSYVVRFIEAADYWTGPIKEQEKEIATLARKLPVWPWAKEIKGFSDRQLGLIVGECGVAPGEYRNPSCLWKRMGMAVINGESQRKRIGQAAIEQGYQARRRSLMWNIGNSILKAQTRNPKDEDGKAVGERYAIGYYGQVYIERRAYLEARGDTIRIHTNAKRYMEKRLLRQLWRAWRAI